MILNVNNEVYSNQAKFLLLTYKYQREKSALGSWFLFLATGGLALALFCYFLAGSSSILTLFFSFFSGFLCYVFLSMALNTRELWVRDGQFTLKQRPIPMRTRVNNIKLTDIENAELVVRNSRYGPGYDAGLKLKNGNVVSFLVGSNKTEAELLTALLNEVLDSEN